MALSPQSNILVLGARGMVGSAIVRKLREHGYENLLAPGHQDLNLTEQAQVRDFFQTHAIDQVVLAAARVGGIHANNVYPAEFIYQNLMIEANVIHQAYAAGVKQLLFLGSSCIYPKYARQPMREAELLTGTLEATNEPYAIAKISGIKLCESYNRQYDTDFRSVMPTNLYGPNDNFDLNNSHVIPAILRKIHLAKLAMQGDAEGLKKDEQRFGPIPADMKRDLASGAAVPIWGTGKARREFLHVDDMAAACIHVMQLSRDCYQQYTEPMLSHINIGMGKDLTIRQLAETIQQVVGYQGELVFDVEKADGTPKKLLDISRLQKLGWKPEIELQSGLESTYRWFCGQVATDSNADSTCGSLPA